MKASGQRRSLSVKGREAKTGNWLIRTVPSLHPLRSGRRGALRTEDCPGAPVVSTETPRDFYVADQWGSVAVTRGRRRFNAESTARVRRLKQRRRVGAEATYTSGARFGQGASIRRGRVGVSLSKRFAPAIGACVFSGDAK